MGAMKTGCRAVGSLLLLAAAALGTASPLVAQTPPYKQVLPQAEQARLLELRADLEMIRKRYLEAIELYREALDFSKDNAVLLNKLGIAYHQVEEIGQAEKYYKKAAEADPRYALPRNNLGTVHYRKRSYDRAVREYLKALEISPSNSSIRYNLGTALLAQGKSDEAIVQFRLALMIDPEVFERRGGFGESLQQRAVEDKREYFFALAKTCAGLGYISRGVEYVRRALENGLSLKRLQEDEALAVLRADPRYQALIQNPPVAID